MVEYTLTVAGAVTQPSEHLDKLGVNVVDTELEHGSFALALDGRVHLASGFFNGFLNSGGVNTSVGNESFERDPRDLAPYGLEAREGDRLGRIVNDKVYACERFDRSDVTSLTTDDSALHLVIGERYNRNGCLGDLLCGKSLNSK